MFGFIVGNWKGFAQLALVCGVSLCATSCATNGDWKPDKGEKKRYNLQFVEGTRFIATWVQAYGRGRTNEEDFGPNPYHEFERQGFEYFFYEGDYESGSGLRYLASYRTPEKLEITATADSLVLVDFTLGNTANFAWIDRRTGALGKELKSISMGEYRLGEFQRRLYATGLGPGGEPELNDDKTLVTSVRPWGKGLYLIDLGNHVATNRARGEWTDFTVPNEFASQPFLLLDQNAKTLSPFNPDSVFNLGSKYWVEVWKSGAEPVGIFASASDKTLVLVKSGAESSSLPLSDIEVDSLLLARLTKSESRGTLETTLTWTSWYDISLEGENFGSRTKRGPYVAPDGKTEWHFLLFPGFEFVNTVTGKRTVYADPID